jgi:hypothetical protein
MNLERRRIVRFAMGTAISAFAMTAHASNQMVCYEMPQDNCSGQQDCQPVSDGVPPGPNNLVECNAPTVSCQQANYVAVCSYKEMVSTPAAVWRSFNGTNHAYTSGPVPPAGYSLEGAVFSLANDSFGGAVAFPMTGGDTLYYYPTSDSSALSADPNLVPIYRYYNPTYGDYLFTEDPSEPGNFPCTPPGCGFSMNGFCYAPIPPNCYLQMEPMYGYGG